MTDTQGCGWDGVHWSIDRLVDDGSANARHELARRLRAAEAGLRDAFDAGALAMRASVWENYNEDGDFGFAMFATKDITKLPGRPEAQP